MRLLRSDPSSVRARALAFLTAAAVSASAASAQTVVLIPYVPDQVRTRTWMPCQLHVGHAGDSEAPLRLEALRVSWDDYVLVERELDRTLIADPEFSAAAARIEQLPRTFTEFQRERRAYAAAGAPTISNAELAPALAEIEEMVSELRERYPRGAAAPFAQPNFGLHIDQVFEDDALPGARRTVQLAIDYRGAAGELSTATVDVELTWLGPAATLASSVAGDYSVHAGDLHVHSCHGEALNACPPGDNCSAEAVQLSGSFTFDELKAQYQALGLDWFASTDHSYCIDTEDERRAILAEAELLTDAEFVCLPDLELSSDEIGPQVGGDGGDLFCLGSTQANHMGAHGAGPGFEGGSSGLFGFCNGFGDVLRPFDENVAAVRTSGGFPLINHPTAAFFGWNSFEATHGIESDGLHGVEIWNGELVTGQDGDVGAWVDWLLAGRILYGYSGSDTHDNAFSFGANHALLDAAAPLTARNLNGALRSGRVYVSNGPSLVLEIDFGGQSIDMGSIHAVPTSLPPTPLTLRAHANFDTATGRVQFFRGRVGDEEETLLMTSAPFSGERDLECLETFLADAQTYYRVYAESEDATQAAYTNPIFFVPGGDEVFAWCLAKETSQGCQPEMVWTGTPSATAGGGFALEAEGVLPETFGLLIYALSPQAVPFQDGTLCVAPPVMRTPAQVSSAGTSCNARFAFDFNAWIAAGIDRGLTAGTSVYAQYFYRDPGSASGSGLTDATCFTIEP